MDIEEFKRLKEWTIKCPIEAAMRIQDAESKLKQQQKQMSRMNIAINEMERAIALIEETLNDGNTHNFDDLPGWKQHLVSEASIYHKYLHILKGTK